MATTIGALDDEYIVCRALLHAWDEIPYDGNAPQRWRTPGRGFVVVQFRCARCTTVRYDVWSTVTGDLVERAYRIPSEYGLPKGHGKKVLVRKEYLNRFIRPKKGKAA